MGLNAGAATAPIRVLAIVEAAFVTGPAKNLLEFSRTVRDSGAVEVSIATFVRGSEHSAFTDAVRSAGIPLVLIAENSAFDSRVIGRIRSLVAETKPHILQTHAVKSHFLVYASGLWKALPWIAFHHGYTTTDAKMRLYNQLDRVSLRKPARLVTVSRAFEQQLVDRGVKRSRITVLHNAVDPRWSERVKSIDRAEARRQFGIAPGEAVLLAIGRLSLEKGHIDLVRAFAQLRSNGTAARLILVGDGPERSNLERVGTDGVVFTGQIRDTAAYYAAADVVILPSLTEGSPNVLLEAMAVDVPVIASRVGGIPEIVRDRESALLVPARSPEALVRAIAEVLSNAALRASLIQCARATIAARHSPQIRAQALIDVYRQVHPEEVRS